MRITDFRKEASAFGVRASATVHWEDRDCPPQTVFYETSVEHGGKLAPAPEAFVTGALMPAAFYGERRIRVDASLCPELHEGLTTAVGIMARWRQRLPAPVIEARDGLRLPGVDPGNTAGSFLSGGVDSLCTLRRNHNRFPPGHSSRIRDCILVRFFGEAPDQEAEETVGFRRIHDAVGVIARDAEVGLIPIQTNVRELHLGVEFYMEWLFGAALASAAHALPGHFSVLSLASSYDLDTLQPYGSHPLIDQYFGSSTTRIRHDAVHLIRLEKVRSIADWTVALDHMKVCFYPFNRHGTLNCGECEKCVRTRLELISVGVDGPLESYAIQTVSAADVLRIEMPRPDILEFYLELLEPLDRIRPDLARAIRQRRAQFEAGPRSRLRQRVAAFDDLYLGGVLTSLYRLVQPSDPSDT